MHFRSKSVKDSHGVGERLYLCRVKGNWEELEDWEEVEELEEREELEDWEEFEEIENLSDL